MRAGEDVRLEVLDPRGLGRNGDRVRCDRCGLCELEVRLASPLENATDAVVHPHNVHGENTREDDGGHPCAACRRESLDGVGDGDVDVQAYTGGEEDASEEVVVPESLVEAADGEKEGRELEDAEHGEEGGVGVRDDEEGDE